MGMAAQTCGSARHHGKHFPREHSAVMIRRVARVGLAAVPFG